MENDLVLYITLISVSVSMTDPVFGLLVNSKALLFLKRHYNVYKTYVFDIILPWYPIFLVFYVIF